jgi:hypothetical protein
VFLFDIKNGGVMKNEYTLKNEYSKDSGSIKIFLQIEKEDLGGGRMQTIYDEIEYFSNEFKLRNMPNNNNHNQIETSNYKGDSKEEIYNPINYPFDPFNLSEKSSSHPVVSDLNLPKEKNINSINIRNKIFFYNNKLYEF